MKKRIDYLPIDKFVEKFLYDSEKGYYATKNPFGKSGDFVTSPSISTLFSEMIAIWIVSFWENINRPKKFNVVELGPGDGKLCKVLIKTFKKFPDFFNSTNIFLYEKSNFLESIQKKEINSDKVKWIKNINNLNKNPTLFFGNEFFDAIPIKQFKKKKNKIYEKYIKTEKNDNYDIFFKAAKLKNVHQLKYFKLIKKKGIIELPEKGLSELQKITNKIKKNNGGLLLIDYGYLKSNNLNTYQSIINHKKNDMFKNLGDADITSLVNFKLLEQYFIKKRLTLNKIVTQGFFLKRLGILERAEIISKKMSFKEKSDLYFRLKRLLEPKYMGELFKVIFAYKTNKKFQLGFK